MQDYKVGEPLAKGYSGHVYLGVNQTTNKNVCIKIMSIDDPKQIKHVREQLQKLKESDHHNVVDVIDFFEEPSMQSKSMNFNIIMELCTGGNLRDYISKKTPNKEEKINITRSFTKQICLGLKFLHEREIVHGKLKLSDLVMDDNHIVKITGIGIALEKFCEDNVGSDSPHVAPEVITHGKVEPVSDVWSVGVILYQFLKWTTSVSSYVFNSTDKIEESLKDEDKVLAGIKE
eukprot:gene2540-3502_t